MAVQVDVTPVCELCKSLSDGKLGQAEDIVYSSENFFDHDNLAVYFLMKLYHRFLTDYSQHHGIGLSKVWLSEDCLVKKTRIKSLKLLRHLLKVGTSANCVQGEETPLLCAVSTHDEDILKVLLENGADPNKMTPVNKMNAVAIAIILNDETILRLLLSYGAKVNEPCCQRLTPLQLSMNKSVNVSKVLLQNGADVQQVMQMRGCNEVFITSPPLIHAVETNNLYLASILLEHGEDVNQCYGECTNSAIHFAILQGNCDMLKLLIQNGANLNKRNGRGHTPLGLALHNCDENKDIAETLITAGCSMTKGSIINVFQRHFPPLHIAAFLGSQNHFDILKLLIKTSYLVENKLEELTKDMQPEEGLNRKKRNQRPGLSCSERAVDLEKQEQQDFINTQALDKSTALYMAVLGGNIDIVRYLVKNGADPYLHCWHGSLLHAAVMARQKGQEVLEYVLQFNFDLDMLNEDGNTCLILASRNSTAAVCSLLVENGALLNAQDARFGETALSASVYFGFESNAEVLIRYGANPDLPDFRDTHALYWAIFNCRERSLKMLLEAGAKLTKSNLATYPKNIKVMKNSKLKNLLEHYVSEPRSLQHHCRLVIRKHLMQMHCGKSIMNSVMSLPLPMKMKSYISLQTENT
ncbi:ankyrin-1-like [Ruditapes philippinarum]|uniref:ankyrin-1-like n=1 Tax=Ruditapes philippinarum TaxID=129788 RepID=UPI00295BCFDD|nr:ankyrin-1-like [Ruditapes philippinarum]